MGQLTNYRCTPCAETTLHRSNVCIHCGHDRGTDGVAAYAPGHRKRSQPQVTRILSTGPERQHRIDTGTRWCDLPDRGQDRPRGWPSSYNRRPR
jgi:hypothetical protein